MINLYSGVIYTIPIPKGDVNEILKKIVKIVSEELGIGVHASLENSTYWATELGIPIGDYLFEFSTNDFKDEWKEEELNAVGLKIKEVTGTKVGMKVQRPWSISINGEELKEEYDFILVDCPAGIEQGFENAVAGAGSVKSSAGT